MLDATDRMNSDTGFASLLGVQPEIDVIERLASLNPPATSDGKKKLQTVSKDKKMPETAPERPEIEYPCTWVYKVIGEDKNLNGILDPGEDTNGNGIIDSPVELVTQVANR